MTGCERASGKWRPYSGLLSHVPMKDGAFLENLGIQAIAKPNEIERLKEIDIFNYLVNCAEC